LTIGRIAMAKFQSPLLGYNNNVRHKGRVFHIQTEDSGVNHPHIITHLFMDGGRILKSVKKSYAEHVGSDGMNEVVRQMMKEQHKAMFIALRDGQFDHIVDPSAAAKAAAAPAPTAAQAPAAAVAAAPPAPEPEIPIVTETVAPATAPESAPAGARAESEPAASGIEAAAAAAFANAAVAATSNIPPPMPSAPAPPQPKPQTAAAKIASTPRLVLQVEPDDAPMTTPEHRPPVDAPPSVKELTLDFDALERDSAQGPSLFQAMDLPPPPKNLFTKERGTGAYRAVEEEVPRSEPRPGSRPPQSGSQRHAPPASGARGSQPSQRVAPPASGAPARPAPPPSDGRYAPARPAAIFGNTNAAPKPAPQSIFSDELVSDKSLDEVILSYLAEDLEPPRRK
jgi:hypothetical protein